MGPPAKKHRRDPHAFTPTKWHETKWVQIPLIIVTAPFWIPAWTIIIVVVVIAAWRRPVKPPK